MRRAFCPSFALLLLATSSAGCSLGTVDVTSCNTNAECRESFGLNAVCGADGLCNVEPTAARCDRTYPADLYQQPERYADSLVIGSLMDRSEPKKVARERAAQLAATQVDEFGGLQGHPIALVMCTVEPNHGGDGLGLEDASTSTARYLANVVGTPAIVGPSSSDNVLAVFEELKGSDTLVISPAATSPALSDADPDDVSDENPGLLWRTPPSDSAQGPKIADDMSARGVTSVAAIVQNGAYGDGLRKVFLEATDSSITVQELRYSLAVERNDAISQASVSNVDEVLFISSESSDIVAFLELVASDSGFDDKTLFLTDAAASVDVVSSAPTALVSRLRGTRPKPLDGSELVYKTFINAYQSSFGEDVTQFSFTAHAYDAAWLVFYGAAWAQLNEAGGIGGRNIARGLRRVSEGNDLFEVKGTTWLDIVGRFESGVGVDLRGSSGDLDFDPTTEETSGEIEVWVVDDTAGNITIVPAP
jgi:branched-chain amino acid transport system substrate-binding protein